jgi:hypothetical protein
MSSEIIRDISDNDKPLCPNIGYPSNAAHQLHVRTLDAFYEATDKDADGELPEAVGKAYHAAAYGAVSDRMDLYVAQTSFMRGGRSTIVEAWWFKCPICGFILPAAAKP